MNEQPTASWYAMMAVWSVIAIAPVVWMWWQVRKQDQKREAEEARQIELDADWDEWIEEMATKQKGKVFDLPRGQEKNFQSRARRAESLGFTDDNPKRAS